MAEYICPHCKKPIYDDDALLCLYCGESLGRAAGFMGRLKYPKHSIFVIILVLIILFSFIALMLI